MLVVMHIYVGKVNRYPKGNDSENIFEIFLWKKKKKKKEKEKDIFDSFLYFS